MLEQNLIYPISNSHQQSTLKKTYSVNENEHIPP